MATPTSGGKISKIKLSSKDYIDTLLYGTKWGGATGQGVKLTYSFAEKSSHFKANYKNLDGDNLPKFGFAPLTPTQRIAAKNAVDAWGEVANIGFSKVTESVTQFLFPNPNRKPVPVLTGTVGDIRFARSSKPKTAEVADFPNTTTEAGDVWFNRSSSYDTQQKGSFGYGAGFLHEIGHALGLKHPHDNRSGKGGGKVADQNIDSTLFTVMSYRSFVGQTIGTGYKQDFFPTTPMLNDIAAIQHLYGANMNTRRGNDVYNWNNLAQDSDGDGTKDKILMTIWDAGGIDTIDWSDQSSNAVIDLNPGSFSELGPSYWNGKEDEKRTLALAYEVKDGTGKVVNLIENANGGSGDDVLIGNNGDNILKGNNGKDVIAGYRGNDRLYGGDGNDWLDGFHDNDTLYGGEGSDTLRGGTGNDQLFGDANNDSLIGGIGEDFMNGGADNDTLDGESGRDLLYGGRGNDLLVGGEDNDFLNGFDDSYSSTEYDTLSGGAGADTFSLGYNGSFTSIGYLGNGYAKITDFNPQEGDKIRLGGSIGSYNLSTYRAGGVTSTLIKYGGDIVGVVENVTGLDLNNSSYFSFEGGHGS